MLAKSWPFNVWPLMLPVTMAMAVLGPTVKEKEKNVINFQLWWWNTFMYLSTGYWKCWMNGHYTWYILEVVDGTIKTLPKNMHLNNKALWIILWPNNTKCKLVVDRNCWHASRNIADQLSPLYYDKYLASTHTVHHCNVYSCTHRWYRKLSVKRQ